MYRPGKLTWPVPPLVLDEQFFDSGFKFTVNNTCNLQAEFTAYREGVIELDKLGDPRELVRYAIACVDFLKDNADYKRLKVSNDSYYLEFNTIPPVGVKEGKILGTPVWTKVETGDMNHRLQSFSGWAIPDTFDALDRAKLWIEANWKMIPDYESVEQALSVLKLCGSPLGAYAFEQALHKGNPEQSSRLAEVYTNERLEEIREVWVSEGSPSERFRKLYDLVIDKQLDTKAWLEIFKSYPTAVGQEMEARKVKQADRGMERFIDYFLNKQRLIKEGKLC